MSIKDDMKLIFYFLNRSIYVRKHGIATCIMYIYHILQIAWTWTQLMVNLKKIVMVGFTVNILKGFIIGLIKMLLRDLYCRFNGIKCEWCTLLASNCPFFVCLYKCILLLNTITG